MRLPNPIRTHIYRKLRCWRCDEEIETGLRVVRQCDLTLPRNKPSDEVWCLSCIMKDARIALPLEGDDGKS